MNFPWLLRVGGLAKCKEHSAKRKPYDFATHWFAPAFC
jgi:hypothetical protein